MKKIYINGFAYYHSDITNKLYMDEAMHTEVDMKFMTPNERKQYIDGLHAINTQSLINWCNS